MFLDGVKDALFLHFPPKLPYKQASLGWRFFITRFFGTTLWNLTSTCDCCLGFHSRRYPRHTVYNSYYPLDLLPAQSRLLSGRLFSSVLGFRFFYFLFLPHSLLDGEFGSKRGNLVPWTISDVSVFAKQIYTTDNSQNKLTLFFPNKCFSRVEL